MEIINATDGYKLGHHRMYPEGTEQVYSNWTPRSNKYFPEATEGSVVFGIQYLIKEYLETGRIESFEIEESKNCYYSTFVFIDDLCDAGGTFLGELKVLKERYPNSKFIIIVCHAVNDKGLVNMCNNFDQVIVSNSHRDINYRPSNENLTVIDVCK